MITSILNKQRGKKEGSTKSVKQARGTKQSSFRRLEVFLAGCLYYSGLVNVARWWTARAGDTLSILCYHQASGGTLREHLLYLRRHYRLLHLEAALEELYTPHKEKRTRQDRRPLLALTFDDGYQELFTYGVPLASGLRTPLTVFLIPGYIENRQRFWWLEPEYLVSHTPLSEVVLQGRTYQMQNPAERQALLVAIEAGLRFAPSIAERDTFLESARAASGVPFPAELSEQEKPLSALTWEEVREIEQGSWVSIGAHTMHHPVLAYLTRDADLDYELSESRAVLEQQAGHPVHVFAYPVGKHEHIGEKARMAARNAGYSWAVTAIHGLNTPRSDPYFLSRIVVDVDQHWLMVAAKASGLWDALVSLARRPVALLRKKL